MDQRPIGVFDSCKLIPNLPGEGIFQLFQAFLVVRVHRHRLFQHIIQAVSYTHLSCSAAVTCSWIASSRWAAALYSGSSI